MAYNSVVEEFRDDEYPMMKGRVYLDHGGATIYSKSLIEDFSHQMITNLYGNPHSASEPAKLSGHIVDSVREKALRFFKADPEHFDLVFVANATAAIKLVAESFRDLALASSVSGTFWYGYHKDAHTSVVGVREYTGGNHHCFRSDEEVGEWLNGTPTPGNSSIRINDGCLPGLFAFPGQSNMTGRRLPLAWTSKLRESTKVHHQNTYSLLDAAALATTTQLDFSDPDTAPDFIALSFYKIFGFPDLGALIVRKKSGHILSWRKYFGGGTINGLTVLHESTVMRKNTVLHEALEDGTLPFHNIVALGCAIDNHKRLYGPMKAISRHTQFLGHRLYTRISSLTHYNGRPACVIYNDVAEQYPYTDPSKHGATIAFNLIQADGTPIRHSIVEQLANEKHIYLRSGGLCNAGGIASHLKVEPWQFKRAWSAGHRCGEPGPLEVIGGKPTGVVRASLGAMSTMRDVDTFITFLVNTFIEHAGAEIPPVPEIENYRLAPARPEIHSRHGASGTELSPFPKIDMNPPVPSAHNAHDSTDANLDIDSEGRFTPRPQPRHQPIASSQKVHHHRRHSSYDFDAKGRVAPRPPPQFRHVPSGLDLKKPPGLRSKRSFFTRKSFETDRLPPSEVSPGVSEFSGSTLRTDDVEAAELQELAKENLLTPLREDKSRGNKSKNNFKFWKKTRAVLVA